MHELLPSGVESPFVRRVRRGVTKLQDGDCVGSLAHSWHHRKKMGLPLCVEAC